MFDLVAPNGRLIVGTFDTIPATATVNGFSLDEAGNLRPEYTGDTEVFWDDQKTVMSAGQQTLVDEGGDLWLARECSFASPEE